MGGRRWASTWTEYFVYTPWFALEQLVQALLHCLGFRYPSSTGHGDTTTSSTDHQPHSKSTQKKEEMEVGSSRSITIAARRPPRPPVSSGRGGKTN